MMVINENYHKYFDKDGKLIYDPMEKSNKEAEEPESTESRSENHEMIHTEEDTKQKVHTEDTTQKREAAEVDPRDEEIEAEPETSPLDMEALKAWEEEEKQFLLQKFIQLQQMYRRLQNWEPISKKDSGRLRMEVLRSILESYNNTIEDAARRKPDRVLSDGQVIQIGTLLRELKSILAEADGAELLRLPEDAASSEEKNDEADEITGEAGEEHRISYGEMYFLIRPYKRMMDAMAYGHLWKKMQ